MQAVSQARTMATRLVNRSVVAARGRTSIRLEPELWDALLEDLSAQAGPAGRDRPAGGTAKRVGRADERRPGFCNPVFPGCRDRGGAMRMPNAARRLRTAARSR